MNSYNRVEGMITDPREEASNINLIQVEPVVEVDWFNVSQENANLVYNLPATVNENRSNLHVTIANNNGDQFENIMVDTNNAGFALLKEIEEATTNSPINNVREDLDVADTAAPVLNLVGTYNYPEMIQANPSLATEKILKGPKRHTKGPFRLEPEEILDQNRKNVESCRRYRENKKKKMDSWEEVLEALQTRNTELRKEEKIWKAKVAKVQEYYINLIKTGRIKCA